MGCARVSVFVVGEVGASSGSSIALPVSCDEGTYLLGEYVDQSSCLPCPLAHPSGRAGGLVVEQAGRRGRTD